MDVREAIYSRRAVREYTNAAVDEKTLRDLIDAAIQAPSAVNAQSWLFCVVRDKSLLAVISQELKAYRCAKRPRVCYPITFKTYWAIRTSIFSIMRRLSS